MPAEHTPLDQLLADLFTTAIDGGITYWCDVNSYHWMVPGKGRDRPADLVGFNAEVTELEEPTPLRIDRAVMLLGYNRACSTPWRNKVAWSTGKPPVIVREDYEWDFDASDADAVVQLGLFADLRYG